MFIFSHTRLAKIQKFNIIFYCKEKQALPFPEEEQMSTRLLESKLKISKITSVCPVWSRFSFLRTDPIACTSAKWLLSRVIHSSTVCKNKQMERTLKVHQWETARMNCGVIIQQNTLKIEKNEGPPYAVIWKSLQGMPLAEINKEWILC